ncbi:MAG: hypothetical protein ACK5T6_05210, partial [Pirellula sp.]
IKIEGLNVERARQLRLELLPRVRSKEEQKRELYNEAISISLESQSQHTGVVSAAKVDDEEPKQDLLVCDAHPSIQGTVSQESVEPIVLDRKEDEIERSR